ncbi:helix-turn-helix domain-containing protein [Salinispirillum marinum]|uniref:Helix-turn-helix domain-containing protein n=2 Tax=Saccharospirillaceae TaxID=255527 RepID=A0ABV8BD29_9GAMM
MPLDAFEQLTEYLKAHQGIRQVPFVEQEVNLGSHIAQIWRRSRTDRGLSQSELASALGVSRAQYLRYESGNSVPRLHTVALWSLMTGGPPGILAGQVAYLPETPSIPSQIFRLANWLTLTDNPLFIGSLNVLAQVLDLPRFDPKDPSLHFDAEIQAAAIEEVRNQTLYAAIGANLRLIRQMLAYSQEDMANALGISTSHYLSVERGEIAYSFVLFPRFAYSMQLPPLAVTINTRYYDLRQVMQRRFEVACLLIHNTPESMRSGVIQWLSDSARLASLAGIRSPLNV